MIGTTNAMDIAMVGICCFQGVMSVRSFADLFTVSMRAGVRTSKERCREIDEMHKCASTLSSSVYLFLCVCLCVFLSVCVFVCVAVCLSCLCARSASDMYFIHWTEELSDFTWLAYLVRLAVLRFV